MERLQRELGKYKLVLFIPSVAQPKDTIPKTTKPIKRAARSPSQTPNYRILDRLDPQIAEVVRESPELEKILTRELVRDIDAKVLDLGKLLNKSSILLSFEVDEAGRAIKRRVERSSTVPSIDRLVLELVVLLEKYHFLGPMNGLRRVFASIVIDQQVEVRFEGEAADEAAAEEVRKQMQNVLTLLRFALPKDDAAFVLGDVNLVVREKQMLLSKSFEKEPLVEYLKQYYRAEPPQTEPPVSAPDTPPPDSLASPRSLFVAPAVTGPPNPAYFLGGTTASFAAFAIRNFTTVLAGILISAPVCGFRPMRAFRLDFTILPIPGMTNWPFFLVSLTAVAARSSKIPLAAAFVIPAVSAI